MAAEAGPVVALVYEDDAYVEAGGSAPGLMGRQVAGRSFLDALLRFGTFSELGAIVRDRPSAAGLVETWREHAVAHPGPRTLRIIERCELYRSLFPRPPASVIHLPQPPEPGLAWMRQAGGPHAFALSGVTHTLCSAEAVALLRELVTAPYEPYDALVCTSRAVARMVREITGAYADYLRSRFGGSAAPERTVRLETIPLGVDVERFRPASPDSAQRRAGRSAWPRTSWPCCSSAGWPTMPRPTRSRCSGPRARRPALAAADCTSSSPAGRRIRRWPRRTAREPARSPRPCRWSTAAIRRPGAWFGTPPTCSPRRRTASRRPSAWP